MRPLPIFLSVTFAISWGWWLWLLSQGIRVSPGSAATHLPGLIGPMTGAAAATLVAGGGAFRTWARDLVAWPRRNGALALALVLLPPAVAAVTLALSGQRPGLAAVLAYPGLPPGTGWAGWIVLVLICNGWGEEAGWRGWLQPALSPRLGRFRATFAVAVIWALWHLPLFFLNDSMAALVGPVLVGWLIGLVCGAFVLAHLHGIAGGAVPVVALWHVAYDLSVATPATDGLPAAVVSSLVMVWGAAVAFQWWRRPG